MSDDHSSMNQQEVSVEELRPGSILAEDLLGFRSGYVLSVSDISKIKDHKDIKSVKIFLVEKREKSGSRFLKVEDLKELELNDQEKQKALTDEAYNKRLKKLVEAKKQIIRGEDYDTRVQAHRESKLSDFKGVLKGLGIREKEETLAAVEDYAVSSADVESLEKVQAKTHQEILARLDRYESSTDYFLRALITQEKVYSGFIEDIVMDFVNDVGYELPRALFSSIAKSETYMDFLTVHSLQVMIVALITAIELTKMIQEKTRLLSHADLSTFLGVSRKFFSIDELVNLAIVSLMHDVAIKKNMPYLKEKYDFSLQEEHIVDMHPGDGYHLSKKLNIHYNLQQAIYQHHERFDGSGYPNGIQPRFFSKYTPLVMFAEHYVELTTPNPFIEKIMTPRDALVSILNYERKRLDGDVVYAFIRAASLFPVGSWLLLSDGRIGIVEGVNKSDLEKPLIRVYFARNRERIKPVLVDTTKDEVKIIKPVDLHTVRKMAGGSLEFVFK